MKKYGILSILILIVGLLINIPVFNLSVNDVDGNPCEIKISKKIYERYPNRISINGKVHIYKDRYRLNVWKVEAGVVTDEGVENVVLGVYNKSPFHQETEKRVFVYIVKNDELRPRYRASKLSTPFEDFVLYDVEGDGVIEIVTLDNIKGMNSISAYKLKKMTIYREYFSKNYECLSELNVNDGLYVKADGEAKKVVLSGDELLLK